MDRHHFFSSHQQDVDNLVHFFTAQATDLCLFEKILEICIQNPNLKTERSAKERLKLGFLSFMDYLYYKRHTAKTQNERSVKNVIGEGVLDLLCQHHILSKQTIFEQTHGTTYAVADRNFVEHLVHNKLIQNVIFGFGYVVDRYSKSVFKITTLNQEGDVCAGTGFVVASFLDNYGGMLIVTNKHVAKLQENLQIFDENDKAIEWSNIIFDDKLDLAAIVVSQPITSEPLYLGTRPEILDDIITIGYPPVPRTNDLYQLAHKGEINAFVSDYYQNEFLLFSAKTSPGNSGGPIITTTGIIGGMVTEQFFEKDGILDKGALPYYAAIPAEQLSEFVKEKVLPAICNR